MAPVARDLALPPMLMDEAELKASVPGDVAALAASFRRALDDLGAAASSDALARAGLALAEGRYADQVEALARRLAAHPETSRSDLLDAGSDTIAALGPSLYRAAGSDLQTGDDDRALTALLLLATHGTTRADAAIGLCICAWRMGRDELAFDLAVEALALSPGHPRACLVAGLAQLRRGQRRAAQTYLAAASRSARRKPDYRDDLREAQRSLLLLHLT